jgi:hypothetical protein
MFRSRFVVRLLRQKTLAGAYPTLCTSNNGAAKAITTIHTKYQLTR